MNVQTHPRPSKLEQVRLWRPTPEIVDDGVGSLPALLGWQAVARGGAPALRHKARGVWTTWSWGALAQEVGGVARGLVDLGFGGGDVMVLLGHTGPRQIVLTLAAQAVGGAALVVADNVETGALASVLAVSGARYVFASDRRQVDRLLAAESSPTDGGAQVEPAGVTALAAIIFDDPRGLRAGYADLPLHAYDGLRTTDLGTRSGDDSVLDVEDWARTAHGRAVGFWNPGVPPSESGDPSLGTCEWLTHAQLLRAAAGALGGDLEPRAPRGSAGILDRDEALLLDALSWRPSALVLAAWQLSGCRLSCAEAEGSADEDRGEIAPTFLFASTDWYARLWREVQTRLPPPRSWRGRFVTAALGRCARDAAASSRAQDPRRRGLVGGALERLALFLVARPLVRALGLGRARLAVAVGEPLGSEVTAFLAALGITARRLDPSQFMSAPAPSHFPLLPSD